MLFSDNSEELLFWIGRAIPAAFVEGVFGVPSLDRVDIKMVKNENGN
jgi:hypothetical protein